MLSLWVAGVYDWLVWPHQSPADLFYVMRYVGVLTAAVPTLILAFVQEADARAFVATALLEARGSWNKELGGRVVKAEEIAALVLSGGFAPHHHPHSIASVASCDEM